MGRPRKRDSDRRNKLFQVRLLDKERKSIYAAADAEYLDASSWARSVLLRRTSQILKTKVNND
jgi:hypothetical protein